MNNDFHEPRTIFELFDGLTVKGLEDEVVVSSTSVETGAKTNGTHEHTNGVKQIPDGDIAAPAALATATA